MSKPFKSLDSLLRLMRKRNITIEKGAEGSRVKRILARDNYYCSNQWIQRYFFR